MLGYSLVHAMYDYEAKLITGLPPRILIEDIVDTLVLLEIGNNLKETAFTKVQLVTITFMLVPAS